MSSPKQYIVKNWERFQHYKDRNPPWIKLHFEILASEDWVMLADASKLLMVVCMMVASRNGGNIPADPNYLKRVAYLDKLPDLTPLIKCGFLINPLADASESKQEQANARPETEAYREETDKNILTGKRVRVNLDDLSTDHLKDWLSEKRSQGRYLAHDENFIVEYFKDYCRSKGKKYDDYVAGCRRAFEWDDCQPKAFSGKQTKDERGKAAVVSGVQQFRDSLASG